MNRRGLSTVVGTVFAIIALTTTVTYVAYSMNLLGQFNQTIIGQGQQTLNQAKEKFQVTGAAIANNEFNITITNTGVLPINFTKIWITDTTLQSGGTDYTYSYVPKYKAVAPGATLTNIGQDFPHTITTTDAFNIELVTSRGNQQQININNGANAPVFMQLNAIPTAQPGSTVQVLYTVMNNQSNNNILLNVKPQMAVSVSGTGSYSLVSGPSPSSFPSLIPGQSVTFKWLYTVGQNTGDTVRFTSSLASGPTNTASTTMTLAYPQFSSQSQTSVQTNGLVCCKTSDMYLILHQESSDAPTPDLQMYSGSVDNTTGKTIVMKSAQTTKSYWITNNDSSTENIIPAGLWKFGFLYNSAQVPTSLQGLSNYPDMIFYFNTQNPIAGPSQVVSTSYTTDSSGHGNTLTASSSPPTYSSSCSRDGSGCVTFSASGPQYYTAALNSNSPGGNNIGQNMVSMAGWIKPTAYPTTGEGTIYRIDAGATSNYFDIGVQSVTDTLQLSYLTYAGSLVTCIGPKVGLNDWTFFAAVRTGSDTCTLYINGSGTSYTGSGVYHNGDKIAPTSSGYIGASPENTNGFTGSIDYLMYWNNHALTTTDIGTATTDGLYAKTYGSNAHVVNIKADITDLNGNPLTPAKTIVTNNTVSLPFIDPAGQTGGSAWGYYNFTALLTNSLDNQDITIMSCLPSRYHEPVIQCHL